MHIGIDKRDIRGILFFRLVFFEQNAIVVHNKVGRGRYLDKAGAFCVGTKKY